MVGMQPHLPPANERYYAPETVAVYVQALVMAAQTIVEANKAWLSEQGCFDIFVDELDLIASLYRNERTSEHYRLHKLQLPRFQDPYAPEGWEPFAGYGGIMWLLFVVSYKANGLKVPRHEVDIPPQFLQ